MPIVGRWKKNLTGLPALVFGAPPLPFSFHLSGCGFSARMRLLLLVQCRLQPHGHHKITAVCWVADGSRAGAAGTGRRGGHRRSGLRISSAKHGSGLQQGYWRSGATCRSSKE